MITFAEDLPHLNSMLPDQCVHECFASGDNYDACKHWVDKLALHIPREACIELIAEVWGDEESLHDEETKELQIKLLWLAAGYGA